MPSPLTPLNWDVDAAAELPATTADRRPSREASPGRSQSPGKGKGKKRGKKGRKGKEKGKGRGNPNGARKIVFDPRIITRKDTHKGGGKRGRK